MTMLDAGRVAVEPGPPKARKRIWITLATVAGVLVLAVMAFAIFEPIQVLPRLRLAPGFALTDQSGATITSEDLRGSVVLYTFTYGNCAEPCAAPETTMAEIAARAAEIDLGDTPLRFVTISFDPERDDPAVLAARAERFGADGATWTYATTRAAQVSDIVRGGFKTWFEARPDGSFAFDPALVLVDGWGIIRGEYRYQTLAADADRILRHIGILGDELRNSHGANSLAYEAAHFFLCYP